ncbi:MAG TPA: alpha/beta hydrolase [Solirubrobacteraceae bacterium]|jgi:pimeloyl-ACP methyl ester carboxylesterase|nr:alpha/beta hydrolase [Solirubrobacteraceae bacterium]
MSVLPDVPGVSHQWVQVDGLRFHVAEAGSGDDVILLLHGWPEHWYCWRHLLPALAEAGHRVLAMDLRGFGWSDAPARGYEKEQLADDVLGVLDALGLRRVKLVGHDWGGWVGFLLCLRAPERFERFFVMNIVGPWVGVGAMGANAWRFGYQWLMLSPGLGALAQRSGVILRMSYRLGVRNQRAFSDGGARESFVENLSEPARARAGVQMYRVFNMRELPAIMRGRYDDQRLTVPTKVLFGTADAVLRPSMLGATEAHAEDMQVEFAPGIGHFIAEEAPDLVAERAIAFLG